MEKRQVKNVAQGVDNCRALSAPRVLIWEGPPSPVRFLREGPLLAGLHLAIPHQRKWGPPFMVAHFVMVPIPNEPLTPMILSRGGQQKRRTAPLVLPPPSFATKKSGSAHTPFLTSRKHPLTAAIFPPAGPKTALRSSRPGCTPPPRRRVGSNVLLDLVCGNKPLTASIFSRGSTKKDTPLPST